MRNLQSCETLLQKDHWSQARSELYKHKKSHVRDKFIFIPHVRVSVTGIIQEEIRPFQRWLPSKKSGKGYTSSKVRLQCCDELLSMNMLRAAQPLLTCWAACTRILIFLFFKYGPFWKITTVPHARFILHGNMFTEE